jgi:hypothetical protein
LATETQSDRDDPLALQLRGFLFSSMALRIRLLLSGVLFPIGCFLVTADGPPTIDSPWQSGRVSDYVAMLLTWPGYTPFFPLLVFSQLCLAAWLIKPTMADRLAVRVGIYGGLILSLQFLLLVMLISAIVTFIIAAFVGPIVAIIVAACVRAPQYARRFTIRHLLVLTAAVAVLIAIARLAGVPPETLLSVVSSVAMYVAMATPALCALAYARASIMIAQQTAQTTRLEYRVLAAITWLVCWGGSWKLAVDIMLTEYAKLPVTDPNCYVSNAAAHGHRRLVGSQERLPSGQPINAQMRRLKYLEIALKAASPRLHRLVRQVYDRFGPPLARQCQRSIWFADATYLLLKPIEYLAESLRWLTKGHPSSLDRLYHAAVADESNH